MGKAAVEIIVVEIVLLKIDGKFVWVWPVLDKKKKTLLTALKFHSTRTVAWFCFLNELVGR